jgi:molybdate transport system substrate-binding protein
MLCLLWIGACAACVCPIAFGAEVKVFAAASLMDVLKDVASAYSKQGGDKITPNFGASSALARQIQEGAPADIFFSADEAKMDWLQENGLIATETRRNCLSNSLVIVVAAENSLSVTSPKDLADPKVKRIAMGDPKAVPIGVYAREYLEGLHLWDSVRKKVVPTENVRAALAAVEAGNADASIVYKTDAAISRKVKIVFEVPLGEGPRITYPVAMIKGAAAPEAARKFLAFLGSEKAAAIFRHSGFVVAAPPGKP